jgi:hypothetical protein
MMNYGSVSTECGSGGPHPYDYELNEHGLIFGPQYLGPAAYDQRIPRSEHPELFAQLYEHILAQEVGNG